MTQASYVQDDFRAGEWSPIRQGCFSDPRYKHALAECLNYVPTVEGSLVPRSGFRIGGASLNQQPTDLLPFRLSSHNAYVLEYTSDALFTPSGTLRLWINGALAIKDKLTFTAVSVGGTPTFTMSQNFPISWTQSAYPQSCLIHFDDIYGMEKAPHLVGRDFLLNITGANTCTLTDTSTLSTITTPVTGTFTGSILLAFQMVYKPTTLPFTSVVGGHRILEYSSQQLFNNGTTASVPDQRAALFSVFTPPIVFSSAAGVTNPRYAEFIDGPYFDSNGPNTPVSVSGTTGNITVGLFPWDTARKYKLWEVASDGLGNGFLNLVANQSGNALPSVANANWALLPSLWNSATTYALGQAATGAPSNGGVPTVYYSQIASNTNHALTVTADWSTTPPAYAGGTTYALGVVVVSAGINYVSIQAGNVGHTPASSPTFWLPVDFATAITNTTTNTFTVTDASDTLLASDNGFPGVNLHYENTGRLIRLKAGPAPWSNLVTYAIGNLVNFNDVLYKALTATNLNLQPDQNPLNWAVQSQTIQWTWGIIKTVINGFTAIVTLKGADLPNTNTIYEYRLGLYSATTGWPTSGTYHEGRVVLTGAASGPSVIMGIPNRIDMGASDQGFNFTPTAPDGTVADANGIALVLNSDKSETINGLKSSVDGILVTTDIGEWIIQASNLNDPITPTSVQAKKATMFSSVASEIVTLPSAHAFIQNGSRRLIEHKSFMDVSAYQVRPNGSDLTRDCQHLTVNGIAEAAFQYIPQPIIWCLNGRVNETACNEQMDFFPHDLFGIGYTRGPDEAYVAPFSFEHGFELLTSTINISSMAVQYGASATRENLWIWRAGGAASFVEYMEPVLDTSGPNSEFNFFTQGNFYGRPTSTQKMLAGGTFLDSAIQPSGVKIDTNNGGVTYYGMWYYAGQIASFVIMGKYIGDFVIANDGSVHIPFSGGTANPFAGPFGIQDVGLAMVNLPIEHAYGYQEFVYDPNNTPDAQYNYDTVSGQAHPVYKYCGYFGLKYRRRGKMLKPLVGSQNGATSFAKTVRNHFTGVYVNACHEINVGPDFNTLVPAPLTVDGPRNVQPLAIDGLVTGVFRFPIKDGHSFDGQICWEQTLPYPGSVLGIGGFDSVSDV